MATFRTKIAQLWSKFLRRLGSRQRSTEILRTLVVVIPLTVLIWVYAERAQITQDSVDLSMGATLTDPALEAAIVDPASSPIKLTLQGSRVSIEALKNELKHKSMDGKLNLSLPANFSHVGQQNADVALTLNSDPIIKDSGVFITMAEPTYVRVAVSKIISWDVAVALPPDMPVLLQNVVFDPPRVTVRGPQPAMETAYQSDSRTATVDLSNQPAALAGTGTQTITVSLRAPADTRLTMSPQQVRMTFEVGTREREFTVPSVPIVVQKLLSHERDQVSVKGSPVVQNVRVRGPANLVSKLEGDNPSIRPTAVLRVRPEDAGQSDLHRDVDFIGLPTEVKVIGTYGVDFDVKDTNATDQ